MIESGKAKNQSELAQLKDISRARFTQILNLLKLDKNIITRIKKLEIQWNEGLFPKDNYAI